MAKVQNKNTEVEKAKQYKGVAKQSIKYGGRYLNYGDNFDIEEKDVEELKQYADIEKIEVEITPNNNDNKDGDGKKEGE